MNKVCTKCGIEFPATKEFFGANKLGKNELRADCRVCQHQYFKRWYEGNKEYKNEYSRQWNEANKERVLATTKKWLEGNKERHAEANKAWMLNNPDKATALRHRHKARKRDLPATLTVEQWGRIKEYFNHQCAYCGAEVSLTQDHLIAVIRDGGYTADNIIPACGRCNSSKDHHLFEEWYSKQPFYDVIREQKIKERKYDN